MNRTQLRRNAPDADITGSEKESLTMNSITPIDDKTLSNPDDFWTHVVELHKESTTIKGEERWWNAFPTLESTYEMELLLLKNREEFLKVCTYLPEFPGRDVPFRSKKIPAVRKRFGVALRMFLRFRTRARAWADAVAMHTGEDAKTRFWAGIFPMKSWKRFQALRDRFYSITPKAKEYQKRYQAERRKNLTDEQKANLKAQQNERRQKHREERARVKAGAA